MIPGPWQAVVLLLAVGRLIRLVGWDDAPLIVRLRDRATGARISRGPFVEGTNYTYDRETLAHFLGCGFCTGVWIAAAAYVAWLLEPRATLYAAFPLALAYAAGLIAKDLDA